MTDHKEIADRIVALGVGWTEPGWTKFQVPTDVHAPDEFVTADLFVTDWRVAGACLQKMMPSDICHRIGADRWNKNDDYDWLQDPFAIVLACLEALEDE